MTAPAQIVGRTKACSACGAAFQCGPGTGQQTGQCWCFDLPPLMPVDPAANCFCPACLTAKLAAVQLTGPK